jgi:hypothetical protein
MRIEFDDDPKEGRTELAFHHYFALFFIGLVLAGVACLLMCLEQTEPMFF